MTANQKKALARRAKAAGSGADDLLNALAIEV